MPDLTQAISLTLTLSSAAGEALEVPFLPFFKGDPGDPGLGVNRGDIGYDIILLMGQSNMSGRGVPFASATDPVDGRIWQWGNSGTYANQMAQASEPLLMHDTPSGIGPGLVFARWYAQFMPPNRRILLVPCAHGGTGFSTGSGYTWKVGETSVINLFENAVSQSLAALAAAGSNSRFVAALWVQGETDGDTSMSGPIYRSNLDAMIAALRTRLSVPDLPFILGQMVQEYLATGSRAAINAVHIDTPRRLTMTGFSYGAVNANLGDGNHYNAVGQRQNGKAMFEAFRRALVNVLGASPVAVSGLSFAQSGQSVVVNWPQPLCRVTDYKVEYDSGGGWAELTRAQNIDCSATVPGLTLGATVQFRVSTINETGVSLPTAGAFTLANLPAQPTGLAIPAPTYTVFSPSWASVAGASSYQLQYKRTSDSTWTNGSIVTGTTATQAVSLPSTSYDFRVAAINAAGTGPYSAVATQISGASMPGILDTLTASSWGAWSTRKLRAAYAGSAIRVRRSSDNAELDIGFIAGANDLDTAALLAFVGGGNGFITKIYDQSGNARDRVQAVAANQPRIVNGGVVDALGANSRAAPYYDGVSSYDTYPAAGLYAAGSASLVGVLRSVTTGSTLYPAGEYSLSNTAPQYAMLRTATGAGFNNSPFIRNDATTGLLDPGGGGSPSLYNGTANQFGVIDSGSNVTTYVNGASATANSYARAGTMSVNSFSVGALVRTTASLFFNGSIPELIAFASAVSAGDRATLTADQKAYYGTP